MKRVLARMATAVVLGLGVFGLLAANAAADAPSMKPLPNAACNQGTEQAFWVLGASLAVPMYGAGFCMTMPDLLQP